MPKKQYEIIVAVEEADGELTYIMEAESPEEAIRLVQSGDAECREERLEVRRVAPVEEWEVRDQDGQRVGHKIME